LVALCSGTILDQYVHAPDSAYKYRVVNSFVPPLFDVKVYNVELTSCSWLSPQDSSIHIWRHWLQICVPNNLKKTNTGFLYIDGGHNPVNATQPPVYVSYIA
jgi:PhoPQ-activated pathogenicity-related protein